MGMRAELGLALAAVFVAGGCARSAKVSTVHLDQPGTHIVSGNGTLTIARNSKDASRVCTRVVGPSGKGRGAKGGKRPPGPPAPRGEPGGHLDVLLFRLCEARMNGDISAEQYAASVQTIVSTLERMATRPQLQRRGERLRVPRMRGTRPGRGGGPGFGPRTPRPGGPPDAPSAGDDDD